MSEILDCSAVALEKKTHFRKDSFGIFKILKNCRLFSCSSNKMELHYIFFSDNFPKFSLQLYQNNLIKSSVMKLSQLKNLWWIPILVATYSICKNRLVYRRCLSGYCEKYVQITGLWSSILVKKTLSLDLPWVRIWKTEVD